MRFTGHWDEEGAGERCRVLVGPPETLRSALTEADRCCLQLRGWVCHWGPGSSSTSDTGLWTLVAACSCQWLPGL